VTYQAREPKTPMERLQEQVEAMYAREDRDLERERFDEAPVQASVKPCQRCQQRPANGSAVFCVECWIAIGPYDRPITEELCDE
jgi:hypothetical protein